LSTPLSRGPFCTQRNSEPLDWVRQPLAFHSGPAATGEMVQGSSAVPFQATVATFQKEPK